MGFDGNLSPVAPFNTSPDAQGAGIWQSGQAPALFYSEKDKVDYLYVNTGDNLGITPSPKLSESVLKLEVGPTGDLSPVGHPNQPASGPDHSPRQTASRHRRARWTWNCDSDVGRAIVAGANNSLPVATSILWILNVMSPFTSTFFDTT